MKSPLFTRILFLSVALWASPLGAQPSIQLSVLSIWNGTISLTWTNSPLADVTGYIIYSRKYPETNFAKLDTVPTGSNLYDWNKGGHKGETYFFLVQSVRKGAAPWEGENSNPVTVTLTEEPPVVSDLKNGVIDIGYSVGMSTNFVEPSKEGLKGYNIYFGEKEGGPFVRVNPRPIANVPTYLVRNLVVGKRYFFNFSAMRADGMESARSKNVAFIALTWDQLWKSLPWEKK
jgi:hypothetical protein